MKVLWIVQDGILAGPGASQTIPYLRGLAALGHRMSVLSVEKERFARDRRRVAATRKLLGKAGVRWKMLPFGSGPAVPRTLLQLARVFTVARDMAWGVDLVHARSHLPGLVASQLRRPFVFDMRGFWPQEKVDGGLWSPDGVLHRTAAHLERRLLEKAAAIVVLTRAARNLLPDLGRPMRVITTAVDLDRFRPGLPPPPAADSLVGKEVLVISGALGTWYLLEEMLDVAALWLEAPDRRLLVLTEEDAAPALRGLSRRGVDTSKVTAIGVRYRRVPAWLSLAAAGLLLIRSAPSKRASAPTKLAEFLACGVPVLITPGIGDSEELIADTGTGVVVRELDEAGYTRALAALDALRSEGPALARRCRRTAEEHLSLDAAVAAYSELYEDLG